MQVDSGRFELAIPRLPKTCKILSDLGNDRLSFRTDKCLTRLTGYANVISARTHAKSANEEDSDAQARFCITAARGSL